MNASPLRLLITSFAVLIAVGTLLLKLPVATPPEAPIGWIDALFTATSATCVTGLIVRDTGSAFTPFGQGVILALIQAGGLGVMSFSLFLLSLFRGRVPLAHRTIYEQTLAGASGGELWPLVRLVFAFTFVTEAAGAAALAVRFVPEMGVGPGLWAAVFHAVSAFCNAGFALWPDSLMRFRGDLWINSVVMALIILGGLGFFVVYEVLGQRGRWRRLSLHSKLVLAMTGLLIALGAVAFWLLEAPRLLFGMSAGDQVLVSLFQSVTTRTAGFNTVDLAALTPATLFLMTALMFIGGSPGSCAGGVKTTTLAVLLVAMKTRLRGQRHPNVFRRTVDPGTVANTLAIALGGVLVVVFGVFVLLVAESPARPVTEDHAVFIALYFEAVSALATVGLSTGITPLLEPGSRLVVAALMFLGRLGPLTVGTALGTLHRRTDWRYPEEGVVVG